MTDRLGVLTVSTSDGGGGAERIARELHERYLAAGHNARLAVGRMRLGGVATREIPNRARRCIWARSWQAIADSLPQRSAGFHLARLLRGPVAEPRRALSRARGEEDFDFPGTREAFTTGNAAPDVAHLHNLHGDYFDLRVLPEWSARVPIVLSLHDAWMLSGHCAHSFGCDRWMTGCGECPALWIHPAVPRDATAFNWERKRDLYARSRLHVGVPCEWLANRVRTSILAPAVQSIRVIPYGVDLDVYNPPTDRAVLRRELGLNPTGVVFAIFANALYDRAWKDGTMFRTALAQTGPASASAEWIAIGEAGPDITIGGVRLRRVPSDQDDRKFARWFQAADAYVHPARADTFPLVNLEAQACGAAVIATAVDGIPEQLVHASVAAVAAGRPPATATGILTPAGNAMAMAQAVEAYAAASPGTRMMVSAQAAAHARARFDRARYAGEYESWLRELVARHRSGKVSAT